MVIRLDTYQLLENLAEANFQVLRDILSVKVLRTHFDILTWKCYKEFNHTKKLPSLKMLKYSKEN